MILREHLGSKAKDAAELVKRGDAVEIGGIGRLVMLEDFASDGNEDDGTWTIIYALTMHRSVYRPAPGLPALPEGIEADVMLLARAIGEPVAVFAPGPLDVGHHGPIRGTLLVVVHP